MQNVLYIDASCFYGGAQASLHTLMEGRRAEEKQLLVAACRELSPDVAIHTHHYMPNPVGLCQLWKDARQARGAVAAALAELRPDTVFLNTLRSALLWMAMRLAPDARIMVNDRDVRCPLLLPRVLDAMLHPDVLAVSRRVALKWNFLPEGRLSVSPNVFDLEKIAATLPARLPFTPGGLNVIMAGDFTEWKNHPLLLRAMEYVRKECPDAKCLLKGRVHTQQDAKYLLRLRSLLARKGLQDCVFINADDEAALPYIAASDCLVSCSHDEPFGRTVVEALALGKTVAATILGADEELLADCTAISIAREEPRPLAEAILRWRTSESRAEVRQAALERAGRYALVSKAF